MAQLTPYQVGCLLYANGIHTYKKLVIGIAIAGCESGWNSAPWDQGVPGKPHGLFQTAYTGSDAWGQTADAIRVSNRFRYYGSFPRGICVPYFGSTLCDRPGVPQVPHTSSSNYVGCYLPHLPAANVAAAAVLASPSKAVTTANDIRKSEPTPTPQKVGPAQVACKPGPNPCPSGYVKNIAGGRGGGCVCTRVDVNQATNFAGTGNTGGKKPCTWAIDLKVTSICLDTPLRYGEMAAGAFLMLAGLAVIIVGASGATRYVGAVANPTVKVLGAVSSKAGSRAFPRTTEAVRERREGPPRQRLPEPGSRSETRQRAATDRRGETERRRSAPPLHSRSRAHEFNMQNPAYRRMTEQSKSKSGTPQEGYR